MTFYTELQESATELIRELGATGTFTRAGSGGTYSAALGEVTGAGSATTTTAFAAVLPLELAGGGDQFEPNGLVRFGDSVAYAEVAASFVPIPGDTYTWNGTTYTVIHVRTYGPSGENLVHEVIMR